MQNCVDSKLKSKLSQTANVKSMLIRLHAILCMTSYACHTHKLFNLSGKFCIFEDKSARRMRRINKQPFCLSLRQTHFCATHSPKSANLLKVTPMCRCPNFLCTGKYYFLPGTRGSLHSAGLPGLCPPHCYAIVS